MRRILTVTALLLATACGQSADDAAFGSLQQPIVNGDVSTSSDDSAVYLLTRPSQGDAVFCTGTVIAPNLVATALHCVTHSTIGLFSCEPDGSLTAPDRADGTIGRLVEPAEVSVYVGPSIVGARPVTRGARLLGTGSTQICRGDLAFVVLEDPLDVPVSSVRISYGVEAGDFVRIVGYGETETYGDSGRHVREGRRVIDVGPLSEDQPSIIASPRTFVVNEGPCHGDSGGPAFAEDTGALVGVYSLAAGATCTTVGVRNVYTHLSTFSSFVLDAFAAADAEPILDEPDAEPERPGVVAESGCSVAAPGAGGARQSAPSAGLVALAALGAGLAFRRRRG